MRIEGDAGHHTFFLDLSHHTMQVGTGFVMYVHDFGAECLDFFDEFLGLYYHEVYVKRFLRMLRHRLHDRKSERDIGDEHAVHNVEVKPFGFTCIKHFYVTLQVTEISRQKGGRYYCHSKKILDK